MLLVNNLASQPPPLLKIAFLFTRAPRWMSRRLVLDRSSFFFFFFLGVWISFYMFVPPLSSPRNRYLNIISVHPLLQVA
jgi:hypothetical protein